MTGSTYGCSLELDHIKPTSVGLQTPTDGQPSWTLYLTPIGGALA
jgi:hypothetical protein